MPAKLNWYSVFLHLILIAFAVQIVFLTRENRALRAALTPAPPPQLEVGELLEPLAVVDLDGRKSELDFSGEQNVLMVFTTRCPYCAQNQPAWNELYARFQDRYRVLGIAVGDVESVKTYAEKQGLSYPVVVPADAMSFPKSYKIPSVPTTVLVGADGRVKKVWNGMLNGDSYDVLEQG